MLAALSALALTPACGDDGAVTSTTDGETTGGDETDTNPTATATVTATATQGTTTTVDPSETDTDDPDTDTDTDTDTGGNCGDGVVDADEECDGDDLGGADCMSEGFVRGDLACNDDCTFDTSACTAAECGDGMIEGDEECEGDDLGGEDCVSQGFDEGELGCSDECGFDITNCVSYECGNDSVRGDKEVCDGTDLAGEDCVSQGFAGGGELACAKNCMEFDTTNCVAAVCGNDTIEGDEVCDGTDLGGEDCASQGFDGGTLGCMDDCTGYDTSACVTAMTMCSTPAAAITSDNPTTTDIITIPATVGFVNDVNVTLDAAHTFVGDIDIALSVGGEVVVLQDRICSGDDDIDGRYDDSAAAPPACGGPPAVSGDVLPLEPLQALQGLPDATGDWQIDITDNAGGDEGTLNEWCVELEIVGGDPVVCGDDEIMFGEVCDNMNFGGSSCGDFGGFGDLSCIDDCGTIDSSSCCIGDVGGGTDFQYAAFFSDGLGCADPGIIDISATGTALDASGNCGMSSTAVTLPTAFPFFGVDTTDWFVNTCAFLSTEGTGGDISNDCPLPSGPSTGTGNRIYALHDDIDTNQGGVVYYEHFDAGACPRDSDTMGAVQCDVFFWDGISPWQAAETFDVNVILYPDTGELVTVYDGDNGGLASKTIGLQTDGATDGFTAACNDDMFTTVNDGAVCMTPETAMCPV